MSLEESKNPNGGNRQGFEVNANQPKGNVTMNSSVASNALTGKITIANTEMAIIEYKGQRVLTFEMIDKVHGRPDGTARKRFSDNREHFIEGEDFYLIDFSQKSEFRTFGIDIPPRGLTVIPESGYLMLVKSFTDDLAWQVQRQLVKGYFKAKELLSNSQSMALPSNYKEALLALVAAEEEKERIALERDHAIATKAQISDAKTATAMNTASQATKKANKLQAELGRCKEHATIIAIKNMTGIEYAWRALRKWCKEHFVEPVEVIDARYGTVKSWPQSAWLAVYGIDLNVLFQDLAV